MRSQDLARVNKKLMPETWRVYARRQVDLRNTSRRGLTGTLTLGSIREFSYAKNTVSGMFENLEVEEHPTPCLHDAMHSCLRSCSTDTR